MAICVTMALTVSSGCSRKKKQVEPIQPALNDGAGSTTEVTTGTGLPGVDQEGLMFVNAGVKPVYFDYDSYALRPDALATLKANADIFTTQLSSSYIQIEGHCDERGTQEYNLALGEKRALAARDYLIKLGVSGDRIITISYGEEVPADPGSNEAAWALNRRCEFNRANR